MSVNNFIPELWSAKLNTKMRAALVYRQCVNTDYEGEIQNAGDVVRINQIGEVTIHDQYVKNSTALTIEELTDYQTSLLIDQSPYFAFAVDNVDKAQAQGNLMDEAMQSAAWGMQNHADLYISSLYADAGATIASTAIDSTNVHAALETLGQKLSENNIPRAGRWCVIPPWITTKLSLAKVKLADNEAGRTFAESFVGRCAGFDLYESNNVYTDVTAAGTGTPTTWYIMAGIRKAISFASQIDKVEAFKPEASFSDAVKGLILYGAKVVYPDALVVLTATVGSEP